MTSQVRVVDLASAPAELDVEARGRLRVRAGGGSARAGLRGLPVLRYADVAAPSVALGEAITRIGCFLNGCGGGKQPILWVY